jgi:hypothetical protein
VLGLRGGLFLFSLLTASAQNLTLSVAIHAGKSCGTAIAGVEDTEARLRAAGFTVAKAHSATLLADIDCVPVNARPKSGEYAIQQCLALSEVVPAPTQSRGLAMATTWRQCKSFTCVGRRCDSSMRSGLHNLVDEFAVDLRERSKARATAGPAPAASQPTFGTAEAVTAVQTLNPDNTKAYYVIYILTCIMVLFRWEWCKHGGR